MEIYRLCRNETTKRKIEEESIRYNLPETKTFSGLDYFEFLREVITRATNDYVLVCHDDVILPINIESRVKKVIENMNNHFGEGGWGIAGNAGVEFFTEKIVRYIKDPHLGLISPKTVLPKVLSFVDGNTLLLNIKNFRKKNVVIPENLHGYQLYDFVLLIESYKKGLVVAADSNLYVIHNSRGDQSSFNNSYKKGDLLNYLNSQFINHKFITINGEIEINQDLSFLDRNSDDRRIDYNSLINNALEELWATREIKTLNIIVRTKLERLDQIRRLLDTVRIARLSNEGYLNLKLILSIDESIGKDNENINLIAGEYRDLEIQMKFASGDMPLYSRVKTIKNGFIDIEDDEKNYVWFIDDDDFIFPNDIKYLRYLLSPEYVLVADAVMFDETWVKGKSIPSTSTMKLYKKTDDFFKGILGDNYVPFPCGIYPIRLLKNIFEKYKFEGDYMEDYTIILLAQKESDIYHYPLLISGISIHGNNTVIEKDRTHWDYSYATFISEVLNTGLNKNINFAFQEHQIELVNSVADRDHLKAIMNGYIQYQAIQKRKFWQILEKYRQLKNKIKELLGK